MLNIEFKRSFNDADIYEKIGNICLKPIRLTCGKTVEIRGLTREEKEAPLIVKIAAFAAIILTIPLYAFVIGIGMVATSHSKSYTKLEIIYQTYEIKKDTSLPSSLKIATFEYNKFTVQKNTYSQLDPIDVEPSVHPSSYQVWKKEREHYLAPYKAKRLDNRSRSPLLYLPIDVLGVIITHLSDPKDVNSIRATSYNLLIAAKKARPIFTSKFILRMIDFIHIVDTQLTAGVAGWNGVLRGIDYERFNFDTVKWKETALNLTRIETAAIRLEQQCRLDAVEALCEYNTENLKPLFKQITLPPSFEEFSPILQEAQNTLKAHIKVWRVSIFPSMRNNPILTAKTGYLRGPFVIVRVNNLENKNLYDRTGINSEHSLIHYDWLQDKKNGDRIKMPHREGPQVIFRCSSDDSTFETDLAFALSASVTSESSYEPSYEKEIYKQVYSRAFDLHKENVRLGMMRLMGQ